MQHVIRQIEKPIGAVEFDALTVVVSGSIVEVVLVVAAVVVVVVKVIAVLLVGTDVAVVVDVVV